LEAAEGGLVLIAEGGGEAGTEFGEEFAGVGEIEFPVVGVDAEQFAKSVGGNFEAVES